MRSNAITEQNLQTAAGGHWSRRWRWLLATVVLVLLVSAGAAYAGLRGEGEAAALLGTDMGGEPAPGFALTDQHGKLVSLVDQRGKTTVLTFLYTQCPDVCPLTAAQLRQVDAQLGAAAEHVAILAISVDPERDSVAAAYAFSARYGLEERWSYLVGSRAELEPIWEAYFVGVAADSEVAPHDDSHGHDEPHTQRLLHTAPLFLIDAEGRLRVVHTTGNDPRSITANLLHDIQILVTELSDST